MAQKTRKTQKKATRTIKTSKNRLTADDLADFKQILLIKRKELVGDANEMKDEALKKSRSDASGDLSSMPIHMADIGTANFDQEFALELMNGERKLLEAIDKALLRIQEGTYGICEETGKQIVKARLTAKPWARYCVEYARKLEEQQ